MAAATPFRGEKDTNWEGGWRVPTAHPLARCHQAGHGVQRDVLAHRTCCRRCSAAAGEPDIVEKLKKGHKAGNKTFKVHIDGYNLLPFLKGEVKENPRKGFFYWSDDGDLMALRYENWKLHFMEQRAHGFHVWQEPFVPLAFPELCTICGAIPSSGRPKTRRCSTRSGLPTACSCSYRPRLWLASFSRPSRSFRPARSRAASASTTLWRRHGRTRSSCPPRWVEE